MSESRSPGTTSGRLPNRTRPPVEQDRVAAEVRRAIRTGRFLPGERLPPRLVLAARHRVSSLTVQRAMNQLLEDGFIKTRQRQGTFVSGRPPHLYRIGLAFQPRRHDPSWSNLWDALLAAAGLIAAEGPCYFTSYLGVDRHLDTDDCQRLQRDLERKVLAGVIFDQFSVQAADLLPLSRTGVPAAAIMKTESTGKMSGITLDIESFFDQALAHLRRDGRRRIAIIALGKPDVWQMLPMIERCYARHGLEYRPEWIHGIPLPGAEWGTHTVRLLFAAAASERPDALVIADDNLCRPVVAGLAQLPCRVPDDIRIVSICNWPKLPEVNLPVDWLGFDLREMLERAVDLLRNPQESGTTLPARLRV